MRVLLLISTTTYRAEEFLVAATALGLEVTRGIDTGPTLAPTTELGLDFRNPRGAVGRIVRYARDHPIQAVIGMDDTTTRLAAGAAAALGLPHNDPDAVLAASDKHRMRVLLSRAGVPSPEFRLFDAGDDPAVAARQIPYPCVLKPTRLSGSRGVIRANDPNAFVTAWHRIGRILRDTAREGDGDGATAILVERFIPGVEVALEGLLTGGTLNVLALFDKPDPLDGPFFEETIYVTPSRLPDVVQRNIAEVTQAAATALGLREGPVHAELRVNDQGPWIVEVAARSIGGLCSRMLRFGAGVSLEELILCHAVGRPIATLERTREAAGVMMIPIPGAGVLVEIGGVASAEAIPGVTEITITQREGQVLIPLPEGSSYLGFIFARGDDPATVEAALRAAHGQLRFRVEPPMPVFV